MVAFIGLICFVNITLMVVKSVETAKRKKKMAMLKDIHDKALEAQSNALESEKEYRLKN